MYSTTISSFSHDYKQLTGANAKDGGNEPCFSHDQFYIGCSRASSNKFCSSTQRVILQGMLYTKKSCNNLPPNFAEELQTSSTFCSQLSSSFAFCTLAIFIKLFSFIFGTQWIYAYYILQVYLTRVSSRAAWQSEKTNSKRKTTTIQAGCTKEQWYPPKLHEVSSSPQITMSSDQSHMPEVPQDTLTTVAVRKTSVHLQLKKIMHFLA